MAAGLGGMLVFLAAILSYIAVAYGIYLLAKKYEPKVHPAWSWIPIVQIYPLVKVSGQPLWWILVLFLGILVPGIGGLITLAACIFIYHKVSERTGR